MEMGRKGQRRLGGKEPLSPLDWLEIQCGWLDAVECMCEVNVQRSVHACVTSMHTSIASDVNKAAFCLFVCFYFVQGE